MEEKPKVIVTSRSRRTGAEAKHFVFTEDQIPSGILSDYRKHAWQAYTRLAIPATTEEAWRRTDLHALPADIFQLPKDKAFENLPAVPEYLLKPLVADQHGGQIVLVPGGSSVELDEKLVRQGVIFTDLKTAEQKYNSGEGI